ncbi:hypothetical protein PspLS_10373 [Pyricularia sp. CBS 133598]|nr:hypothetical protein PspLS_10373 [Pyricularia sp. CBS 133598]
MAANQMKTIVATGVSSGLGFEAIKQLLSSTAQPYRVILGARNPSAAKQAFDALKYDTETHRLDVLPLQLNDLGTVRSFAKDTLDGLGSDPINYLFLNAAVSYAAKRKAPTGSGKWCESYVVNHLSQHYLTHLLRERLVESMTRVVVVSSGAFEQVSDPSALETTLKAGSGAEAMKTYPATKFSQLLNAHWWRRQLHPQGCTLVAVSPGFIPSTGLSRETDFEEKFKSLPGGKSVQEGAASLLAAFTRNDLPEDPDLIFLTSWGEWWGRDKLEKTLDKGLQDKWSPGLQEIEAEEGLL